MDGNFDGTLEDASEAKFLRRKLDLIRMVLGFKDQSEEWLILSPLTLK